MEVVFLDKGKEAAPLNLRPICLLSELHKLWCKIRQDIVADVLAQCPHGVVGGRARRKITEELADTLMRLDVREEAGIPVLGLHSDLTRCYEKVNLRLLADVLKARGVPAVLVEVAMATYRGPKLLTLGTVTCHAPSERSCGMPAGCPLAVYFLSILTATLFERLHQDHGDSLSARGYVDDIVFHTLKAEQCAHTFETAHTTFRDWVTAMGFQTNHKTAIWHTKPVGRAVTERLADVWHYAQVDHVRDLGVDLTTKGVRQQPVARQRLKEAIRKVIRLQRLTGFTVTQKELGARMIIVAKALWGCELSPLPACNLEELQSAIARFVQPTARNVKVNLCFLTNTGGLLPLEEQACRTLRFWHGKLQSHGGPSPLMQDCWLVAKAAAARGKLGTIIDSLWNAARQLGWQMQDWTHWEDDTGIVHNVLMLAPRLFQHMLRDSVRRKVAREVARRSDYADIGEVDATLLRKALSTLPSLHFNKVRYHLAGGGMSIDQECRHAGKLSQCPRCAGPAPTWPHMLWQCGPDSPERLYLAEQLELIGATWTLKCRGLPNRALNWHNCQETPAAFLQRLWHFQLNTLEQEWAPYRYQDLTQLAPVEETAYPQPAQATAAPKAKPHPALTAVPSIALTPHAWIELETHKRVKRWECSVCKRIVWGPGKKRLLDMSGCLGMERTHQALCNKAVQERRAWQAATRLETVENPLASTHELILVEAGASFGCVRCGRQIKTKQMKTLAKSECQGAPR
eukprot:4486465-Amphidinium_carterae.1